MNNDKSNFFNENAFTFTENTVSNSKMLEVYRYVKGRVAIYKQLKQSTTVSVPEEIKQYKDLLDCGAITEEEYQLKKTDLLSR